MNTSPTCLATARRLVAALRELAAAPVPPRLLADVFASVAPTDRYVLVDSPLGPCFVAYGDRGVTAVAPAGDPAEFERYHAARRGRRATPVTATAGAPRTLDDLPGAVDLSGLREFERKVLAAVREIPRGETRSYSWVAREIGHPAAVRAVGTAVKRNPIPLLIPCHRVVRADGSLGEYALGAARKRELLAAEGVPVEQVESFARAGTRYVGSDTTRIFCLPLCRHARRIAERHRVPFRDAAAAAAAGFRACKVCRPA